MFTKLKKELEKVLKSSLKKFKNQHLENLVTRDFIVPGQKSKEDFPLLSSGISALRYENHLEKMP